MNRVLLPHPDFATTRLDLETVAVGQRLSRIARRDLPDPLAGSKGPSRFSDPRRRAEDGRFAIIYLGTSPAVCFVETLVRDQRDTIIGPLFLAERELEQRTLVDIDVVVPLCLVDLRGNGPLRMGIPSDVVRGSRHPLARAWSLAIHEHPAEVDGIIYPSRLNGEINLAIFGRAASKLKIADNQPLGSYAMLATLLDEFNIALV